jgi:hypothetical protein
MIGRGAAARTPAKAMRAEVLGTGPRSSVLGRLVISDALLPLATALWVLGPGSGFRTSATWVLCRRLPVTYFLAGVLIVSFISLLARNQASTIRLALNGDRGRCAAA